MNRQQKEAMISLLKDGFVDSSASFIVNVNGLTVEQLESLREKVRQEGGKVQVAKVRLMKRALENSEYAQELEPYLKKQIALVFAHKEAPAIAKVICGFAKEHEAFSIVAGCMESSVFGQDAIKKIASLPPREVLLAQLAATLNAPMSGLVVSLHQVIAKLAYALRALEEKKKQTA